MKILYDGVKRVKIWQKPQMSGHICGICGPLMDYTGDLVIGPHDIVASLGTVCPYKASGLPFGAVVSQIWWCTLGCHDFVDSWDCV